VSTPTKIKRKLSALSPKWLAKYDEAITLLGQINKEHGELLLNFNPDGKVFESAILYEKLASVGKNHKLAHKYFYKSIANKNVKEATRKLGRNTLCHCGSGLKFKKCCA
jgi:uncharacterized protein YecA (UPF0149 family)